jgi:cytoskeletal protein CcmA (bactofilin family)
LRARFDSPTLLKNPHSAEIFEQGSKSMWNRETSKSNVPSAPVAVAPEPYQPAPAAVEPAPLTPVAPAKAKGSSLVIKGELSGSEDLAIEGRVEGKISLPEHVLTIGLGAHVSAEVIARVVIVHGSVNGNITAFERVEVKATGRMNGDLTAPKVQMSDGATFTGRLETRNPAKGNAKEKTSKQPELVAV